MSRTSILGILIALSITAPSPAVTLSESFNGPTLDSRLYITTSSNAYSVGQLTPGATWQMSKQAGTSVGAAEIHTIFKVGGNFSAELNLNRSALGTGEVGIQFGTFWNVPIVSILARIDEARENVYVGSGYGIAGYEQTDPDITLRLTRTGNLINAFANGFNFGRSDYSGTDFVTIFLRPNSGNAAFDPQVGSADAHSAALNQFTLTADAFLPVPEPTSLTLVIAASAFVGIKSRRIRHRSVSD
jgi:hypothetical protein